MTEYDLIWNITSICPWNCSLCCVDATKVSYDFNKVLRFRQESNLELSFNDKLKLLNNLKDLDFKLDFSGGEPLVCSENIEVIKYAARKYGKERFSISTTAIGLKRISAKELTNYISELDFTYDGSIDGRLRPRGFNHQNLMMASLFKRYKLDVTASMPLSKENINEQDLIKTYKDLYEFEIENLHILRYFPVGRAVGNTKIIPSKSEYKMAISLLRELESKYGYPKVRL